MKFYDWPRSTLMSALHAPRIQRLSQGRINDFLELDGQTKQVLPLFNVRLAGSAEFGKFFFQATRVSCEFRL